MLRYIKTALNRVQVIDKHFALLAKANDKAKVEQLIQKLDDKPEIVEILAKFMKDLNAIGINQSQTQRSKFRYYIRLFKFRQLHSIFWELCALQDVSQHSHKLKFNINQLGLLDPKNFSFKDYTNLLKHK